MGSLIHFAIIGIQLTSTLVTITGSIPLKCLLQNHSLLNVFGKNTDLTSNFRFNTLKENTIILDKNGWLFEASNVEYKGLDDAVLDDFGFNLISNVSQVTFHMDMEASNLYKTSGFLFSIPISGEGTCVVNLKNVQIGMIMPFDIKDVNGQKLIELKGFDYWYDVRDNAEFKLSNLYYGNKELGDSMQSLMNQNWKYITVEFGKIFMDSVAKGVYSALRNNMLKMTLKDFNTC